MMNIPPSEADQLSLPEYEAILDHWNAAHETDRDDVQPPDPEVAMAVLEKANLDERLIH